MTHFRGRESFAYALVLFAASGFALAQNRTNDPAALAAARGQVQRAQTLLNIAQQRVAATWKADPAYMAVVKEQKDARKAFDVERDRVIDTLRADPEIAEMKKSFDDANADVTEAQHDAAATQPNAAPETLSPTKAQMAAAQEKLDHKMKLRKVVTDAIMADPQAAKAKMRLDKANADLQVMELQHKAALLNDPDYKSALDQLTQARAQMAQAAAGQNP